MSDYSYVASLNVDKIFFAPVEVKNSRKSVNAYMDKSSCTYEDRIKFQLNVDEDHPLVCKWPVDQPQEGQQDNGRRNLQLLVSDKQCIAKLRELDARIVKEAMAKSKEWFKKDLDEAAVKFRYKSIVVEEEDLDEHTLKVKVQINDGKSRTYTQVHQINKEESTMIKDVGHDIITKDSKVTVSIGTMGLWFMGDSFGMSLKADTILIEPHVTKTDVERMTLKRKYVEVPNDGDAAKQLEVDGAGEEEPRVVLDDEDDQAGAISRKATEEEEELATAAASARKTTVSEAEPGETDFVGGPVHSTDPDLTQFFKGVTVPKQRPNVHALVDKLDTVYVNEVNRGRSIGQDVLRSAHSMTASDKPLPPPPNPDTMFFLPHAADVGSD